MQVPLLKHLALCSEGALCPVGISGFDSMRALSRRSEKPELASCPWDKKRDGFVMSDGAGILVLEEYNHAKNRGAKIYGEILGFGLSGANVSITGPSLLMTKYCKDNIKIYKNFEDAIPNAPTKGNAMPDKAKPKIPYPNLFKAR